MEKNNSAFVMEIWCKPYDNGLKHHEIYLFNGYGKAMEFINQELAKDGFGFPASKEMIPHLGYDATENDKGEHLIPSYIVKGHWREGGIRLYPILPEGKKVYEGMVDVVEIYPLEVK